MNRAIRLALGLLLAAAPVAASTQAVTDISLGQTLTRKAGGKTDIYRFVGGSGTTIKATLTAPGKSALILYTPAGEEMLTAQGNGTVTLEAILPLWNVFYLGVIRERLAVPYSLKLADQEASAAKALFSHKVGFAGDQGGNSPATCWIEPGVSKRKISRSTVIISTIDSSGRTVSRFFGTDGQPKAPITVTTDVEDNGDEVRVTHGGIESRLLLSSMVGEEFGPYIGMTCSRD